MDVRRADHRHRDGRAALVRPLGGSSTGSSGLVGDLDRLAAEDLPVPEGFVLTDAARLEFARSGAGSSAGSILGEELDGSVREALISLSAARVAVRSDHRTSRRGLCTIPAVLSAIRSLWLPEKTAGFRPTLVQRDARPERIVRASRVNLERMWLAEEDEREVSRLILEAEYVLGTPLQLYLELERGRWQITSVVRDARRSRP